MMVRPTKGGWFPGHIEATGIVAGEAIGRRERITAVASTRQMGHPPLPLSLLTRVCIALPFALTPIAYVNTRRRCTATGASTAQHVASDSGTVTISDSTSTAEHTVSGARTSPPVSRRRVLERMMTGLEEKQVARSMISMHRLTTMALTALLCCHRSSMPHLRPLLLPLWRLVILPCSMPWLPYRPLSIVIFNRHKRRRESLRVQSTPLRPCAKRVAKSSNAALY